MSEPRRRRRRRLAGAVAGVMVLVVLAVVVAVWRFPARWWLRAAGPLLPVEIGWQRLDGRLAGPVHAEGLRIDGASFRVRIARLDLDWRDLSPISGRPAIEHLVASGVEIEILATASDPWLPTARRLAALVRGLPSVRVAQAQVDGVDLSVGDATTSIDRIDVLALELGRGVAAERIGLRLGPAAAELGGRLPDDETAELELDAAWSVDGRLPRGQAKLTGTLDRIRIQGHQGLGQRGDGVGFDATIDAADEARLGIAGTAELAADILGVIAGADPAIGPVRLAVEAELQRTAQFLRLEPLTLVREGGQARIEGRIDWPLDATSSAAGDGAAGDGAAGDGAAGDGAAGELELRWWQLQLPLDQPRLESAAGHIHVVGSVDDYQLREFAAELRPTGSGLQAQVSASGRGDRCQITLDAVIVEVLGGALDGRGRVAWDDGLTWAARVAGERLDPAVVWPDYPGDLRVALETSGTLAGGGDRSGSVTLSAVTGVLREQPVDGHADLEFAADRLQVRALELSWGAARMTATGTAANTGSRFEYALAIPDLHLVAASGEGSLEASGQAEFGTDWRDVRLQSQVQGTRLGWSGHGAMASVAGTIDIDLAGSGVVRSQLQAIGVAVGDQRFDQVTGSAEGNAERHELQVQATAGDSRLAILLGGRLSGPTGWAGRLDRLDWDTPTARWQLRGAGGLELSPDAARLERTCWHDGAAELCVEASWRRRPLEWTVTADATRLPVRMLSAIPGMPQSSGPLDLAIDAHVAEGVGRGTVELTSGPSAVSVAVGGSILSVAHDGLQLRARLDADGASGELAMAHPAGNLTARIEMPDYRGRGLPSGAEGLSGRVRGALAAAPLVAGLEPGLAEVDGAIEIDVEIGGNVAAPSFAGAVRLRDGVWPMPRLGIALRRVELTAQAVGPDRIELSGSAESGDGRVVLAAVGVRQAQGWSLDATAKGARFTVVDRPAARLLASPDLKVEGPLQAPRVSGTVTIPEADIEYRARFRAVRSSADVVLVDAPAAVAEPALLGLGPAQVRIQLVLGEQVNFEGAGLDARVEGEIELIEEPSQPTRAIGQLALVDGTYEFYGQELTVERGRFVYAGGRLTNPGLDVRASRRLEDDRVVGASIAGSLDAPETTLFSSQPMEQSETLEHLLFGRSVTGTAAQHDQLLVEAAESIGLHGANLLVAGVAGRLGFDSARIETSGSQLDGVSLALGKVISKRLSIGFGLGLQQGSQSLRLRYRLSDHWTVETSAGDDASGELLYRIER